MCQTSFNMLSYRMKPHYKQLEDVEITEQSTTYATTHTPITTTIPPATEILTTSEPSTTTTLRIVDATIAVDKVEPRELISNFTHATMLRMFASEIAPLIGILEMHG